MKELVIEADRNNLLKDPLSVRVTVDIRTVVLTGRFPPAHC